jgi:2-polyprenyl-6-methoxyphenol hydroxylase-like FAD-dependent oxidoreductase
MAICRRQLETTTSPHLVLHKPLKVNNPAQTMSRPTIAVIGAGMSGLVAAGLLHKYNIPVTLYEGESSASGRDQGGTLDMHAESGQYALNELGLWKQFMDVARYEADVTRILDKNGKVYMDDTDSWFAIASNRPEIDRTQLRKLLFDAVPSEIIKWNHHVTGLEKTEDGKVTIAFREQESVTVDLVIGAEGAWSKVRTLLTDIKPFYSGITSIEVRFTDVDARHPHISAIVGPGSHFVPSYKRGIFSQRLGDGSIRSYMAIAEDEGWLEKSGVDWKDISAAKQALLAEFDDFSDGLKQLISESDDDVAIARPLYMLPVDIEWETKPYATLLGDAAHLMTPFAGKYFICCF